MSMCAAVLLGAGIPVALFSIGVSAQTADFKSPAPGTVVEFSDGQKTTWVRQQGNFCRLQQKNRDDNELARNWFAPAAILGASQTQVWADQFKPWTLWPLSVGKKIARAATTGQVQAPASAAAGRTRSRSRSSSAFAAKAGTFDTFVVVFDQEGISHRLKSAFRQWYAPEPGVTVKFDFNENNTTKFNAEAVSIHR